ncbi:MAG: hypothetical protein CSA58_11650 [Micrococcales bacterium]|nr:MAG: hypothetical protein CSB46_04800 [Micrococcales bacterium]PIE26023.1 MAG: hypothetical protein CSA58_11650 [Micrococcales bacterium]
MRSQVVPTGKSHEVGVEDMFFSTTDRKGVIEQANSVFLRIARYQLEDLVGAPHNIIRHPDMPGGAFQLTWDMLLAETPTCAYVKNLAGDGSAYWAFATIVPVGDGYLSVRTRPCREDLLEAADHIYMRVRTRELQERLNKTSAHACAVKGAEWIQEELQEIGFNSYLDFILAALPAEVEARAALTDGIPQRDEATGGLAEMLTSITAIESIVTRLSGELVTFQAQADQLSLHVDKAAQIVTTLDGVLDEATQTVERYANRGPVLASSIPALHTQNTAALNSMNALLEHVDDLRIRRSELRFSVALSQLQAEAAGRFVVELIEGGYEGSDAVTAIRDLVTALEFGLTYLANDLQWNVDMAASMSNEIGYARNAFAQMQSLLAHWRLLVPRYDLTREMEAHMPVLDRTLAEGVLELAGLAAQAGEFTTAAVGFDVDLLMSELRNVLARLQDLHVSAGPN